MNNKTVEEYLNEVSYDFVDYIPSTASLGFVNFIKMVNGTNGESNKTPTVHYQLLDNIFSKKARLAVLCHRGFAKSTLLTSYLPFYIAVFGKLDNFGVVNYILAVLDSQEGGAKALSLDSQLQCTTGVKLMRDIQITDKIFGSDGLLHNVTAVSEVFNKPMYLVSTSDGRSVKCSEDHLWTVKHTDYIQKNIPLVTVTTKELLDVFKQTTIPNGKNTLGVKYKYAIPVCKPVEYSHKEFPLDPYTLGALLGDGALKDNVLFTTHKNNTNHFRTKIPYQHGRIQVDSRNSNVESWTICGIAAALTDLQLRVGGLDKFIPEQYQLGSVQQRLELLQGLMDTDGTSKEASKASQAFSSSSKKLVEGVRSLVYSLGGIGSITSRIPKLNGKEHSRHYRLTFTLPMCPFTLEYKKKNWKAQQRNFVTITNILEIPQEPSKCISIDSPDHLYLTNDFVVTHNTMRRSMEQMYNNSEFLKKYIKDTRFTDDFIELENVEGHRLGIKLTGAQMAIRGTRFSNKNGSHRPELVLMDDILKDSDAKSPAVIEAIEHTIHRAVDKALHPTRNKIIYIGTVFSAKDPLYKVIESGRWSPSVYPVCEQFPCSKEEFRGSWEDRFPYEVVKRMYDDAIAMGRPGDFNVEMMNRVMSEEDRLILDEDITWYKRTTVMENKNLFNFYITTDFATSEKNSSDFSVISVWAYNANGDWLWVDGVCKRQLMDKNIDDLFRLAQKYKPQQVGIEVTGQQAGFIAWIQNEMITRNIYFPLASEGNNNKAGIRPNTNKMMRFNTVVPWFKLGKMWFPEELKLGVPLIECMDELRLASPSGFKSRHDDFIDTISMLSSLKTWKPSEETKFKKEDDTDHLWELDMGTSVTGNLHSYIV